MFSLEQKTYGWISRTTAGSEPGAAPNTGRGFRVRMPDVIMNGPEGRLEGRYQHEA